MKPANEQKQGLSNMISAVKRLIASKIKVCVYIIYVGALCKIILCIYL